MEKTQVPYQNIHQFIKHPFGDESRKDVEFLVKYQKALESKKLNVKSILEVDGAYYIHVLVPSDSQKGVTYDVVLQFFTDNDVTKKALNIEGYYIKFFSNSPSFIYKYASLYKSKGFLIEALIDKFDNEMIDTLPTKLPEMIYDKSIYVAIKYLIQHKYQYLAKITMIAKRTRNVQKFIEGIRDFKDIQLESETTKIEKQIRKELKGDKEEAKSLNKKKEHTKTKTGGKKPKTTGKPKTKAGGVIPKNKKIK